MGGKKRAASPVAPPNPANAPKPDLLNADSNPTLRYPVAVFWGSYGWLDVTRTTVRYTMVVGGAASPSPSRHLKKFAAPTGINYLATPAPVRKDALEGMEASMEGFEFNLSDLRDIQFDKSVMVIQTPGARIELAYLPQSLWGETQTERAFNEEAQSNIAGTMAVQRGMRNFDGVLAEVKPPAAQALDVTLHAEPSSVEKGRSVSLTWSSSNATGLDLEPGVGHVGATGEMKLQPQDSTNYTLTAIGPAGTKVAGVFVAVTAPASLPTLVLTEPAASEGQTVEVARSPLVIQGVVMDASGMPVVTVNGRSVTMRPTSPQAAQFKSDPFDLHDGENKFEVSAINSSQGQTKLAFIIHLTSAPSKVQPAGPDNSRGLGKAEILSLLKGDVPSDRVTELVKERGIKFAPTPDDLKDIRSAGGSNELVDAISQATAPARN